MQRAPCSCSTGSSTVPMNSRKSPTRSRGSRSGLLDPLILEEAAELAHLGGLLGLGRSGSPLPVETGWSPFGSMLERPRARACSRAASPSRTAARRSSQSSSRRAATARAGAREVLLHERAQRRRRRSRRALRSRSAPGCSGRGSRRPRRARTRCRRSCRRRSSGPVGPSTTTRPPVMYSQPWSPTPSTTALTPELRTAKRSPARPRKNARPGGRAVEDGVADDHVLLGDEGRSRRAAERRARRRRGPCRRSRWRRRRA